MTPKRAFLLGCLVTMGVAASFNRVWIRNGVLTQDLDGGGHTISNATFDGDGSGLTGVQGELGADYNISVSNITSTGWIKLQGRTNEIGDNGTALTFNGTAIGIVPPWTNIAGVLQPNGQGANTNEVFVNRLGQIVVGTNTWALLGIAPADNLDRAFASWRGTNENSANGISIGVATGSGDFTDFNVDISPTLIGATFVLEYQTNAVYSAIDGSVPAGTLQAYRDSTTFWKLDPTAAASTTPYTFNTSLAHTSGLLLAIANTNGNKFTIDYNGLATSAAGFASTATDAAVTIAATGWTNTFGKNAVVYYDGTAVTTTVYNGAGTAIYTNAVALTGNSSVLLQPSGKVILSGTGVTGRATPF